MEMKIFKAVVVLVGMEISAVLSEVPRKLEGFEIGYIFGEAEVGVEVLEEAP